MNSIANLKNFFDPQGQTDWCDLAPRMSDKALLKKLESLGIRVDKYSLEELGTNVISLEQISDQLIDRHVPASLRDSLEVDWVWLCLTQLWKRWYPNNVVFEILYDKVEVFSEMIESNQRRAACRYSLKLWPDVRRFFDKCKIETEEEFRDRYSKYDEVLYWIDDFERALFEEGLEDSGFMRANVLFCEEVLRRLAPNNERCETTDRMRQGLAESHFALNHVDQAERLYETWLDNDPYWSSGWISWAACYETRGMRDFLKAQLLLERCLALMDERGIHSETDKRNRYIVLASLVENLDRQGMNTTELRREMEDQSPYATVEPISFEPPEDDRNDEIESVLKPALQMILKMPLPTSRKITNKQPCPCGSNKKFKHCCGVN